MCNCTPSWQGTRNQPHRPDLGIKKIALDPAESSAIERLKSLLGQTRSFEAM